MADNRCQLPCGKLGILPIPGRAVDHHHSCIPPEILQGDLRLPASSQLEMHFTLKFQGLAESSGWLQH